MTAFVAILSTSITLHFYPFILVTGIIKVKSLSKVDDYSTILLSILIIPCIRSLQLIYYLLRRLIIFNLPFPYSGILSFKTTLCLVFLFPP